MGGRGGRRVHHPERDDQPSVWAIRPLGLDGRSRPGGVHFANARVPQTLGIGNVTLIVPSRGRGARYVGRRLEIPLLRL